MAPMPPTAPGTEMNVMPEMVEPIMPKATKGQGACLPARKKFKLVLLFLLVK